MDDQGIESEYHDIWKLPEDDEDYTKKDIYGATVLHRAVGRGQKDRMIRMLDRGADIDTITSDGTTSLMLAISFRRVEIVEYLIERGASVNIKLEGRCAAIHFAAERENKRVVGLLIDKGADIQAKGYNGNTVLHYAASVRDTEMMELFIEKGVNINSVNNENQTPLHHAVENNSKDVAEYLIKKGASMHMDGCESPFMKAIYSHLSDMIKLFIDNDFDIKSDGHEGSEYLYTAIRWCSHDVAELLLLKGAKTHYISELGNSAVHMAVVFSSDSVMKLLLEQKDINFSIKNATGNTPLHVAIKRHNFEAIKMLLEKGADIYAVNNYGNTPLSLSKRSKYRYIKDLLREREECLWSQEMTLQQRCFVTCLSNNISQGNAPTYITEECKYWLRNTNSTLEVVKASKKLLLNDEDAGTEASPFPKKQRTD